MATDPTTALYRNPDAPLAARVDDLLGRMTRDEKLAQLGSLWALDLLDEDLRFDAEKARAQAPHGLGQITRVGGSSNLLPVDAARLANAVQRYFVEETRLGIPALVHEECCSGYMARGATVYPQALGVAATWQPHHAEAMAAQIRRQIRAAGGHQALSPVLDVTRDPRWGRTEETFGEDHHLAADFGVAFVRGLQGTGLGPDDGGILATGKHFVGYGLSEGGMNWAPAHIPPRELREVFVHPFAAAVREAGLGSVMNAYHELDGVPCGADEALLTDLLRGELGFDGLVVSDYFAVHELMKHHRLAADRKEAAVLALRAGIDVELPRTDCYGDPLREALDEGRVDEALVDRAVRRVLEAKVRLGLFERPYVDAERVPEVFARPAHLATAQAIAEASFVLLKNEDALLPLTGDAATLAVIGPNAHHARNLYGDYAYPAHIDALLDTTTLGSDDNVLPRGFEKLDYLAGVPSVLDALRDAAPDGTEVAYAEGCAVQGADGSGFDEAVALADRADVAVLALGGRSGLTDDCTCGEARDRTDVGLPGEQEALVRAVAATGTPVVLVLVGGRPFALTRILGDVQAVLHAWLPGEAGARAVARTLFGEVNPGGKLPISVPRTSGQIPVYYNHKPSGGRSHWKGDYVDERSRPLFAFGHGLSYTTFAIEDVQVPEAAGLDDGISVRCLVRNTGSRAGSEVVQVYARPERASVTRPVKQLVAYRRVELEPGAASEVALRVPAARLRYYDRQMRFGLEPGPVRIMVGRASDDLCAQAVIDLVPRDAAETA